MTRRGGWLLGALLSAAAGTATAQTRDVERGDSLAKALFHRIQPPALSIALAHADGKSTRWQIGVADLARGTHAGRDTRFRIGSNSKLFTAAIAARLVAQGKLQLDAPISTYLPALPPAYRGLTARQLAGHLGGVRHYGRDEFVSRVSYSTVAGSLGIFLKDTLLARPGTRYFYSSYGYNLLGAVLEAAAGESFADLLRKEVTEPLGARHIALEPSGRLARDQALPYSADSAVGYRRSPTADLSDRWPSGGIVATAEELARFGIGMFAAGYLPDSIRTLFFAPQHTESGTATPVGLGWRIAADSLGRRYLHHGGSSMGGRAFLLVYPDQGVAVALLANTEANFGEAEALRFAALFLAGVR